MSPSPVPVAWKPPLISTYVWTLLCLAAQSVHETDQARPLLASSHCGLECSLHVPLPAFTHASELGLLVGSPRGLSLSPSPMSHMHVGAEGTCFAGLSRWLEQRGDVGTGSLLRPPGILPLSIPAWLAINATPRTRPTLPVLPPPRSLPAQAVTQPMLADGVALGWGPGASTLALAPLSVEKGSCDPV